MTVEAPAEAPKLVKPLDRAKPFRRVNNKAFRPEKAPNGDGVACGCHTPESFGKVEDEFVKFLEDNLPVTGPVLRILEGVRDAADAVGNAAAILAAALAAIPFLAALGALGGPIGEIIALLGGIGVITAAISNAIGTVLDIITAAIRAFFVSVGKRILARAIRVVPQWVPVKQGASNARFGNDQIIEVEGTVTRSFGNPVDVPFFQWHHWFNWNVQVHPEPEYANALSPAGNPPNTTGFTGTERPLARSGSFEIQWDPGALFPPSERQAYETGFPDTEMPRHDGPMIPDDWCWPTTGMFVWASGRWVYDCSRVTAGADPKMCSMMNPCKAMATARWQAVFFADQAHGFSVPAIQFMFVASQHGGYITPEAINDQDYEFILDLPEPPPANTTPFPIAHSQHVPHNTIVLRPRLLRSVRPLTLNDAVTVEPVIEFIRPEKPLDPPRQVKVTVPLTSLGPGARLSGFVLSLGWFDPGMEQAARVKFCDVSLTGLTGRLRVRDSGVKKLREMFAKEEADMRRRILERIDAIRLPIPFPVVVRVRDVPPIQQLFHNMANAAIDAFFTLLEAGTSGDEEWLMRFGLNGQWKTVYMNDVTGRGQPLGINFEQVTLGEEDELFLSVHGSEFDPVGDMMRAPRRNRVITENGAPVTWEHIVNPDPDPERARIKHRDMVFQYVLKVLTDTTADTLSLGLDNNPLGIIDPDSSTRGTIRLSSNPLLMKGLEDGDFLVRRRARFARAVGDQYILAEDGAFDDYAIEYTVSVRKQLP